MAVGGGIGVVVAVGVGRGMAVAVGRGTGVRSGVGGGWPACMRCPSPCLNEAKRILTMQNVYQSRDELEETFRCEADLESVEWVFDRIVIHLSLIHI